MGAIRVIGRAMRDIWDDILPLGVMNVITLLLQVTVVLGPPALAALHAMSNKVANGFAIKSEQYFGMLRAYFVKSWLFALPGLIVNGLILWNVSFYGGFDAEWAVWVQGAWLAGLLFWNAIQFYMFPFMIAQEDKRWRIALRNSALVAGANPLYTFVLLLTGVLLTGLSLFLLPLFFFLGLAVWTMLANTAVVDRLAEFRRRAGGDAAKDDAAEDKLRA